jgi:hypothetical protein
VSTKSISCLWDVDRSWFRYIALCNFTSANDKTMKLSIALAIPASLVAFSLASQAAFAREVCSTPHFYSNEVLVKSVFNTQVCPTSYGLSGVLHTIETTDGRASIAGCKGYSHTPTGYTSVDRPLQGTCQYSNHVTWYKNAPPLTHSFWAQTPANTVLNGSAITSDPDGDFLTYSAPPTTQKSGTVAVNASTGAFAFTPQAGFQGDDFFNVTVTDGKGGVGSVTLYVKIGTGDSAAPPSGNLPPVFPTFTSPLIYGQIAIELRASDPENGLVTIQLDSMPAHGTLQRLPTPPNTYLYTAHSGYNGNDRFAAVATDNVGNRTRTEFPIVSRSGTAAALAQMYTLLLDDD